MESIDKLSAAGERLDSFQEADENEINSESSVRLSLPKEGNHFGLKTFLSGL